MQLNGYPVGRPAGPVGDVDADPVALGFDPVAHHEQPLLSCLGIVLDDEQIRPPVDIHIGDHHRPGIELKRRAQKERRVAEAVAVAVQE